MEECNGRYCRGPRLAFPLAAVFLGVLAWPCPDRLPAQDRDAPKSPPVAPPQPTPDSPGIALPPVPTPQSGPALRPSTIAPLPAPGPQVPSPLPPGSAPPPSEVPPPPDTLSGPPPSVPSGPRRFSFPIPAITPVKDLLPAAPKVHKPAGPVLSDDLSQVPEVEFQATLPKGPAAGDLVERTAHTIARINHLNARKTDGFLEALRGDRLDLAGLPFSMGDACRTRGERSRQLTRAVATVRRCLNPGSLTPAFSGPGLSMSPLGATSAPAAPSAPATGGFWEQYAAACAQEDKAVPAKDREQHEHVTLARLAALMQVLAPESVELRVGLVKYLSAVAHAEATRALAKLALFSGEDEVRQAALEALKVRRERDYTDLLLQGLRYPWPAVARRSGEAVVKLDRTDLVPQLVEMLDEPDPRSPVLQEKDGKKVPVIREVVRLNHHRSCLMCHAPGNTEGISPETLTAPVPVPNQPLSPPSGGYANLAASPDVLVRIDVTYLRQDFSLMQPVADAAPWPEMQRFDFLVRTRTLTESEASAYRDKLGKREPGRLNPSQRAAVAALRELTGKDTAPTAEAWRKLLDLPARGGPAAAPLTSY